MSDLDALPAMRPRSEARAFVAAVTFLTRLPLGGRLLLDGEDVARSGPAFPLVGAAIGAAVGGTALALSHALTPLLASAVAVGLGALLTGALHVDALADTADALAGGSRAHALEIMRDHAVGAYGAVAIVLDLVLKTAALSVLLARGEALRYAVAAGALSRLAPVLLAAALPYARPGGGAGAPLTRGGRPRAVVASALALALVAALGGGDGLVLAACSVALVALAALWLRRWLGGVTGDTLGAASELTELLVLVCAVALVGRR